MSRNFPASDSSSQPPKRKLIETKDSSQDGTVMCDQDKERYVDNLPKRFQETTLPEFLVLCHTYLQANITVEEALDCATKGEVENAENKWRPDKILVWTDFLDIQKEPFDIIMDSSFAKQKLFDPEDSIAREGFKLRNLNLSSEINVRICLLNCFNYPAKQIFEMILRNDQLGQYFNLKENFCYSDHANYISTDNQYVEGNKSPPEHAVYADEFYVVCRNGEKKGGLILVAEIKPPHKIKAEKLKPNLAILAGIDVVDIINNRKNYPPAVKTIASVITQAFHYMILGGVEFGLVYTGEVIIYLRIPRNEYTTVYYHFSWPVDDVKESGTQDVSDCLHLTAVWQMVAFMLTATKSLRRSADWVKSVTTAGILKKWVTKKV